VGGELRKYILLIFFVFTLNSLAETLVSLSPAITEIIYFVNAQKKLIADTTFCNYPQDARRKIKIGGIINPNIEKIASLHPDFILTTSLTPERTLKKLKNLKFKVITIKLSTVEDIANAIEKIGNRFGENGKVKKIEFLNNLTYAESKLSSCISGKKVIVLISPKPLYTSGESTFIGEIVKRAKAINIAGKGGFFPISLEQLVYRKPDIVIVAAKGKQRSEIVSILERFKIKYVSVNPDNLLRPSPRIIKGIQELEEKICKE
jgi:iron complex transport system substrate-binding protein